VLSESLDQSIEIANEYATEHLEIQTRAPEEVAKRISNAGAIFLGDFSPVSLGDYLAGSNHVLPTGQQAKFGPGLGPHSFLRPQQLVSYTKSALQEVTQDLETFANAEGLSGHGDASRIRFS
jgi:histidinol dehydrogenase